MEKKFNQREYINDWNKKNKFQFNVKLNIEEAIKIDVLLRFLNISRPDFVREAYENLKIKNNITEEKIEELKKKEGK